MSRPNIAWHNFVRDFPETKLVPLKKAKPLDGLLRDRPVQHGLLTSTPFALVQALRRACATCSVAFIRSRDVMVV